MKQGSLANHPGSYYRMNAATRPYGAPVKKRLIVTGDDYGLTEAVNEAIEECLAAGTMSATCVMVNMPVAPASASLRAKFPGASIGLHWNVTQGRPLLGARSVPTLVSGTGQFAGSLSRRWLAGRIDRGELRAELSAQYERFCALAGAPDFWNTHQNVHVFPGVFQFFVALGTELGIAAMRSHERFTVPARGTPLSYALRHPMYWLKGEVIRRWSNAARGRGVRMPDGRLYLPGYVAGGYMPSVPLRRLDWSRIRSAVELIIHPAKRADSSLLGSLTESRLREYELFSDPRLAAALCRAGIDLVGFDALGGSRAAERAGQAA